MSMAPCPPLCIVQARYRSTRLPFKMMQELGGETLIARAVRLARVAFGDEDVVVACPATDQGTPLAAELERLNVTVYWHDGPEHDVLSRFFHCAHRYRWHPDAIVHRWTPDDPFKDVEDCRRVANGERLPVELGGEAFTLFWLGRAQHVTRLDDHDAREHIGRNLVLFPCDPPPAPPGQLWTIDTAEDLDMAERMLQGDATIEYLGGDDLALNAQ